jgi:hypothetical protein
MAAAVATRNTKQ